MPAIGFRIARTSRSRVCWFHEPESRRLAGSTRPQLRRALLPSYCRWPHALESERTRYDHANRAIQAVLKLA